MITNGILMVILMVIENGKVSIKIFSFLKKTSIIN